jgi:lysophospholipase L1-like esterase
MGSEKHDERLDYALGIDAKDMADGCLDYGLMLPEYEHPEELRIRRGMPNALNKLIGGGRVAVGYIGGSITQQNGWRPRTTAWLKSRFSSAQIVEINAAISGTAADFGAARIDEHVLAYDPDLVFVEFVVNGGDIPSMEGLVRKIRKRNPHTDICFVYTLKADRIPSYQPGAEPILPDSLTAFEAVADHYGIPSIDFGYVLGD